jgi:hypothetical protein
LLEVVHPWHNTIDSESQNFVERGLYPARSVSQFVCCTPLHSQAKMAMEKAAIKTQLKALVPGKHHKISTSSTFSISAPTTYHALL